MCIVTFPTYEDRLLKLTIVFRLMFPPGVGILLFAQFDSGMTTLFLPPKYPGLEGFPQLNVSLSFFGDVLLANFSLGLVFLPMNFCVFFLPG